MPTRREFLYLAAVALPTAAAAQAYPSRPIQAHKVADLDRHLAQIDTTIEEAAKRGRTKPALSTIEGQRRDHAALVG